MIRLLPLALAMSGPAFAESLYRGGTFPALAADRQAGEIGDVITIVIAENRRAINSAELNSRRRSDLTGSAAIGSVDEDATFALGGGFTGVAQARRQEQLAATISATVSAVLPNGDLVIAGDHRLMINGERTRVRVRGRVRPADIGSGNSVLSSRIADAEIDYDGKGFVSRGAKPGLIGRLLAILGLV